MGYTQDRLPVPLRCGLRAGHSFTQKPQRRTAAPQRRCCRPSLSGGRVRGAAAPPSTTTAAAVEKQRLNLICYVCTQAPKYISERLRVSALCWSHVSKTIASVTVLDWWKPQASQSASSNLSSGPASMFSSDS